jgi:hypothetical protein
MKLAPIYVGTDTHYRIQEKLGGGGSLRGRVGFRGVAAPLRRS